MNINILKLDANYKEIGRKFIEFYALEQNPEPISDEYLMAILNDQTFYAFVALDNDKVVGALTAFEMVMYTRQTKEAYLYEIDVDPEYRKQGIATRLIESLKLQAKSRGVSEIFVGTEPDNVAAIALYKKTSGQEKEDYTGFTFVLD